MTVGWKKHWTNSGDGSSCCTRRESHQSPGKTQMVHSQAELEKVSRREY